MITYCCRYTHAFSKNNPVILINKFQHLIMPSAVGSTFKHISVRELHPTFGAEISGVDFSVPLTDEIFSEVHAAITKVRLPS
jgi:hypothetical protein